MIEVLKRGDIAYTVTCNKCHSLLKFYEHDEVKTTDHIPFTDRVEEIYTIKCPVCENKTLSRSFSSYEGWTIRRQIFS